MILINEIYINLFSNLITSFDIVKLKELTILNKLLLKLGLNKI